MDTLPGEFFLPVLVLSVVFRGKFLDYLERAYDQGELTFPGMIWHLVDPELFKRLLIKAAGTGWIVYTKEPFSRPEDVLEYFSRYVHRVAIANHRLVSMKDGIVTFRYRDYADNNKVKLMSLAATNRGVRPIPVQQFLLIRRSTRAKKQAFLQAARAVHGRSLPGKRRFYGKIRVGNIILDGMADFIRNRWQVVSGMGGRFAQLTFSHPVCGLFLLTMY